MATAGYEDKIYIPAGGIVGRETGIGVLAAIASLALTVLACNAGGAGGGPPPATPTTVPASLPPLGQCSVETGGVLIQPELAEVQPPEAAPGEEIKVMGSGGYVQCGSAYDESARSFLLYWDGEPIGEIDCYVNHCETTVAVPADAVPGDHTLSTEGGAGLEVRITGSG